MKHVIVSVAALISLAPIATAQSPGIRPEIRPYVGATIPLGAQRDVFETGPLFGLQAALELRPSFHVVGSFGWVTAENGYHALANEVSIFQYDVGIEVAMVRPFGADWLVKPFAGAGGGARTYDFQAASLDTKTCSAGYLAAGTEFQLGRTAFRLEGRDNIYCYRSPIAGIPSKTRNDIGLSVGVAYHIR